MPAIFKMSDDKTAEPVVIAEVSSAPGKVKKTKKYVIIAVSAILGAAIILAAILVGMYMFTEAQKEILKYTLDFNNGKQEVVSDPNSNIVKYHVVNSGQEVWVVNDFNKDIQVVKIQTATETNCYMNALNRSNSMDPTQITKPETNAVSGSAALTYMTSNTPVSDTSFLSKAARDMCSGISIYWVYPHCSDKTAESPPNATDTPRSTRAIYDFSPYYYWYTTYYGGAVLNCVQGCCRTICACRITFYSTLIGGVMHCNWVYSSCPHNGIYANPVYDGCTYGPRGLRCPSRYPRYWPTC